MASAKLNPLYSRAQAEAAQGDNQSAMIGESRVMRTQDHHCVASPFTGHSQRFLGGDLKVKLQQRKITSHPLPNQAKMCGRPKIQPFWQVNQLLFFIRLCSGFPRLQF